MIPRDQISTLGPYSFSETTSGAIQYGVPTIVVLFKLSSLICAQKPKSVILIWPSVLSKMLSDLMSSWMTPVSCKNINPFKVSRHTAPICPSVITSWVTISVNEPPSMYSITTHSSPLKR